MRRTLIALAASVVALGTASAQEVYVEEDLGDEGDVYVEEPAYGDPDPVEPGVIVGPRVYGWQQIRPDNCGTFKYWNGEYCADARFNPPEE